MKKYFNERLPFFWYGGDYNPDQWLKTPHIIDDDIKLMKLAGVNAVSLAVFSWAQIEKTEGNFDFSWLDEVMNKLYENGIYTLLATPSAALPAWLTKKYPQVLRATADRVSNTHGSRVNYCLTSKVYREKCTIMATQLAKRYQDHPGLIMWHINNEMAGDCYCPSCRDGFREWLKEKYTTLDNLNEKWWTAFWGHTYSSWGEVDAPGFTLNRLDRSCESQVLDYKRFMSQMNYECYKTEANAIKKVMPNAIVTMNTWRIFGEMDFDIFKDDIDVIGFDSYPQYHDQKDDYKIAQVFSFSYDVYRNIKGGEPFALIETSPSSMLAYTAQKLKRPGIHKMACMQAVAHGADSILYFQWRKGRGGNEKTHGAVVDHYGKENTRVFKEIAEIGNDLTKMTELLGTYKNCEVAIIFDPQNAWLMRIDEPFHKTRQSYQTEAVSHYAPFWNMGIGVDVIHPNSDFSKYKLVIAPMQYMQRKSFDQKIRNYVENGGNFVSTYLSNYVDETDLCILGGYPGNLTDVFGMWAEELDILDNGEHLYSAWIDDLPTKRSNSTVEICFTNDNELGLDKNYIADTFCELIHLKEAKELASYNSEFYKGVSCATVNNYKKGKAYYIGFKGTREFYSDFYKTLAKALDIKPVLNTNIPCGVTVQERTDGNTKFLFIINFTNEEKHIDIGDGGIDLTSENIYRGAINLKPYQALIIKQI